MNETEQSWAPLLNQNYQSSLANYPNSQYYDNGQQDNQFGQSIRKDQTNLPTLRIPERVGPDLDQTALIVPEDNSNLMTSSLIQLNPDEEFSFRESNLNNKLVTKNSLIKK